MKLQNFLKNHFTDIAAALLIFLFVYASSSKLLDYQKFRAQLGQSPMLTAFAGWVAWLVPAIEILIATALAIQRFRLYALYASFILMTMFSAYIIAITKFSEYVPCSCGGILQNLSWGQHLIFNLIILMMACTAIIFCHEPMTRETDHKTEQTYFIAIETGQAENL